MLPPDVTAMQGPVADLDELTAFLRAVTESQTGRATYSRDWVGALMALPGFDPATDMLIVRDAADGLVAATWITHPAPVVRMQLRGYVAPSRLGEGIGTHLLTWAMDRAGDLVDDAPEGARVSVSTGAHPGHEPSMRLLADHGFGIDRYFLEMRMPLDGDPVPAALPDGIELRTYGESDLEALYDAIQDAFRDHFGFTEEPREQGLARFRTFRSMPTFDPTLTWLAIDGDEIAGNIICIPEQDGDRGVGYVGNLGVRPRWRGRGLAKALLRIAFDEFRRRGKTTAALHVDATNPTGATRLYESVGMHETERTASLELELRPGDELMVR